jgi:hypothetical protein
MKKTGRNEQCTCGSGKKFKKCCMNQSQDNVKVDQEGGFFLNYNTTTLLKILGGLFVTPENHGKNVRLEKITCKAIQYSNSKINVPTNQQLQDYLDFNYPSDSDEDETVNTFTDLITYIGGDFLVFPGISSFGTNILTNLLNSIHHWPYGNLSNPFVPTIRQATSFALALSNEIARKLNYVRYMPGERVHDRIFIPDSERLNRLRGAVTFTAKEIEKIFENYSLNPKVISDFLLNIKEVTANSFESLVYYPIVERENEYIVASPATLVDALINLIWDKAKRLGDYENVISGYHRMCRNNLELSLSRLKFKSVEITGFVQHNDLMDGIYQFDDDKIAYVKYIGDRDNHNTHQSLSDFRTKEIIELLKKDKEYGNFSILSIDIISGIGKDFSQAVYNYKDIQSLAIPIFEFELLVDLNNIEALDLWKFSIARNKFYNELHPRLQFSFLDELKLFRDHSDSFYLSDEDALIVPYIEPGYSKEWYIDSKVNKDRHSVTFESGGHKSIVPVERIDKYSPVYANTVDVIESKLRFAVDCYKNPFWVFPSDKTHGLTTSLKSFYYQITDLISYWTWQLSSQINILVDNFISDGVNISFSLNPIEAFDNVERNYTRKDNVKEFFSVTVKGAEIKILIPSEIIAYFYGPDNEGEKVIVEQIMFGINMLLPDDQKLTGEQIQNIIAAVANNPLKKKFFILDSADNLLIDPSNLSHTRYVQDYDVSTVLDQIVPLLGDKCPPVGEINSMEDKNKLANDIVQSLLAFLTDKLNQYDSLELIKRLTELNENIIAEREEFRIKTPTRIACYVSIEQHQEDLKENIGKLNRTSIAVRCLLEHLAAEQVDGNKLLSTSAIDEIIALMDQIILWGSLSDQLHYNLLDINIGVLPTSRIGTDKVVFEEVFDPYYESKTEEDISDAIETFGQVFPQLLNSKGKDIPERLNLAFQTDLGFTLEMLLDFMFSLAIIGLNQEAAYALLNVQSIIGVVNKFMKEDLAKADFTEFQVGSMLSFLSIEKRGKIIKLPEGHEFIDIMPWRFNRMLSLNRKPIVIYKGKDNISIALWGPRQVLSSRIYLADQIQSNRLRVLKSHQSIRNVLGDFAQERGDSLVTSVIDALKSTDIIIDKELFIRPKSSLVNSADIGDIDVLVINPGSRQIYSLECKSMSPSRNIKEMVEEVGKLLGSKSEEGWIQKHLKRDSWSKENLNQLSKKYNLDLSDYMVKSFIVTKENMLTPYLIKKLPIPFVTLYDLRKYGLKILEG